eukprot:806477_1
MRMLKRLQVAQFRIARHSSTSILPRFRFFTSGSPTLTGRLTPSNFLWQRRGILLRTRHLSTLPFKRFSLPSSKLKRWTKYAFFVFAFYGTLSLFINYPGFLLEFAKPYESQHALVYSVAAMLGGNWFQLFRDIIHDGWISLALDELGSDETDLNTKKAIAKLLLVFAVFPELRLYILVESVRRSRHSNDDDSLSLAEMVDVQRMVELVIQKLVSSTDKELVMTGLQIVFGCGSEVELKQLVVQSGGLEAMCEVVSKPEFSEDSSLQSMTSMSLSALVRNLPGLNELNITLEQKEVMCKILLNAAAQLMNGGNIAHAELAAQDCLDILPEHPYAMSMLAAIFGRSKRFVEANNIQRALITIYPEMTEMQFALASNLYRHGGKDEEKEEAVSVLKSAISSGHELNKPETFTFLLVEILETLGRPEESVDFLRVFCESDNGKILGKAHAALGKTLLNLGRSEHNPEYLREAISAFQAAVDIQPIAADNHFQIAQCKFELGEWEDAMSACSAALNLRRDFQEALRLKGAAQKRASQWNGAAETFKKLVDVNPHSPEPLYQLGISLEHCGNQPESLEMFEKAVTLWTELCGAEGGDDSCARFFARRRNDATALSKIRQRECHSAGLRAAFAKLDVQLETVGKVDGGLSHDIKNKL